MVNKKRLLSFIAALIIYSTKSLAYEKRYSNGTVYIGDKKYLESIKPDNNDILVLDERDKKDANMRVYASFLISDPIIQDEIIDILLLYEKEYPSCWERSKESMKLEWICHNILSRFSYKNNRTDDVDFNNSDEILYKVLTK